jgi:PAS domain S-box-containing protein
VLPAPPSGWYRSVDGIVGLVGLGLAYFALAKFGLGLASLHPSASPIWPPSGLALAAFMLWGTRVLPAIWAGAFLANATTSVTIWTSMAIATGNSLEALVTAWLLARYSSGTGTFRTPAGVARFAALALAPGTMISATFGVGSLVLGGHAPADQFQRVWMTWWLGDVGGQVLVTPVIVLWAKAADRLERTQLQKLAYLLALTAAVGLVAFSPVLEQTAMQGSLAFLAIGPMLWAGLRYDQRHTATAALVLSAFVAWGTVTNGGPFARATLNDSFLLALTFVISVAVPSLVLSADVAVRRASEERYRALVENASDVVLTLDLDLRVTSANPAAERFFGDKPTALIGAPLSRYVPEGQLDAHRQMLLEKSGEPSIRREMEVTSRNGARTTLEMDSRLIRDDGGRAIAIHTIARDVSERKSAEARQGLLVHELQHRSRNMLAVIQSVVSNTLAGSRDVAGTKEAIIGRLHALAKAQEFVSGGPAGGVALRELIESELSPFSARASISGEPVVADGSFAQMFALVLHELATNAVKHGSLSTPTGRVLVRWETQLGQPEPELVFSWRERDGPQVEAPGVAGFGTRLISTALGGSPQLTFAKHGFEFTVRVPLSRVLAKGSNVTEA